METKPRVTRLAPVLNERLNEDHNFVTAHRSGLKKRIAIAAIIPARIVSREPSGMSHGAF